MVASHWRYQSWFDRFAIPIQVVVATLLLSGRGRAAEVASAYCPVARAPLLSTSERDDCARDEDGNGLDDAIERKLATCFAPAVAFDSEENALGPDEPHVVFSARLMGSNLVTIRYVYLFRRDTGYIFGADFPCLKYDHNGDVAVVDVDITWLERDRKWFGAPITMHTSTVDQLAVQDSTVDEIKSLALSGTHPLIYATAGKHHWSYRQLGPFSYGCDCGPFGRCGTLHERADGQGPRIVPSRVNHAPGFHFDRTATVRGEEVRLVPEAPLTEDGRRFANACELRKHGRAVPTSAAILSNDLGDLGYDGERIWGPCFRGGLGGSCDYTGPISGALAWDAPFVSSGDSGKLVTWLLGDAGSVSARHRRAFAGLEPFIARSKPAVPLPFNVVSGLSRIVSRWIGDRSSESTP